MLLQHVAKRGPGWPGPARSALGGGKLRRESARAAPAPGRAAPRPRATPACARVVARLLRCRIPGGRSASPSTAASRAVVIQPGRSRSALARSIAACTVRRFSSAAFSAGFAQPRNRPRRSSARLFCAATSASGCTASSRASNWPFLHPVAFLDQDFRDARPMALAPMLM